jgi:hypothetical protein
MENIKMNKSLYVYRSNRVIKIKDGITIDDLKESGYFEKHPDTIVCSSNPPTIGYQNCTIGAIVEYKNPYPDELGTKYKVIEIEYVESNCHCLIEALVPMRIKPVYWAWGNELTIIA